MLRGSMSPLSVAVASCAAIAAACWMLSIVTREHAWVDRVWSLAPIAYVAWFFASADRFDARLLLMTLLVGAWGARLTYNFARKGGYRLGADDYRLEAMRARMSPRAFAIFNAVFIAGFQNALLLILSLSAWVVHARPASPLGPLDYACAIAFVGFLVGETIADEQQWRFQCEKKAKRERGEPIEQDFVATGLFRYSRHPNYFCEQGMWWTLWGFTLAAGAPWLSVALVGPVLLTLVIHGSTGMSEALARAKYPAYTAYCRRTSRWIPLPPRA